MAGTASGQSRKILATNVASIAALVGMLGLAVTGGMAHQKAVSKIDANEKTGERIEQQLKDYRGEQAVDAKATQKAITALTSAVGELTGQVKQMNNQ